MPVELSSSTRVLHVGKFFPPVRGGMENHLYHLVKRLQNHVDVRVLASHTRAARIEETVEGVRVVRLPLRLTVAGMPISPAMVGELRRAKADIIHFHVPNPTAELACLVSRPRAKLVSIHQHDVRERPLLTRAYRAVERAFFRRQARIIAAAPENIEYSPVLREFKDRARVIPLGVEPEDFRRTPERDRRVKELRAHWGERIVFFLGRHVRSKGIDYLIRAMREVEGRLVLGSDGPATEELRQLACDLGIESRVTFAGDIADGELASYYQAADVFCLPSVGRLEAFGIVQLEAMSCGVPVVSTRLETGVVHVNRDGETGLVVPPGDAGALAAALNRLLGDEGLRRKLGEQAQARVRREFTHDVCVRRTLELYREVLAE
jgi:rhamnosyl/mannosyltransferase